MSEVADEFKKLFQMINALSMDPVYVTPQHITDHFEKVCMIQTTDGSVREFLHSLDKMLTLMGGKLSKPGSLNETEFVRFWFNCHRFYNKFDLKNTGNITKDEFYESMVGTAPDKDTQEKVNEIFNIVDRNDDGKIDFIEFFCRLPQILNMK